MDILTLLPLSARKSDNYCICNSLESDNFRESNQEKKQRIDTKNEANKIKSNTFRELKTGSPIKRKS